ncbi:SOS response UmuD protein [Microvirgula sp. AG722]|uniref:LexA family protein n=1 Tax=Microvirgula sp. AG722 TaxID=2183901 RepID=UPI000DC5DDC9|nr:translesion error-prone DNA polymerase V autoproteolytic subunit [Microvirgula sp. AG722]RAS14972.1 SOS response UmuD protein [Microvirgula sp. AG722]
MTHPTHGGKRDGAGRPAGSGRIDTSEPLTQTRIPVADKEAVIDFVIQRQARRLARTPSPAELARRNPGTVMLPAADAPRIGVPLFGSGVRAGFPSPADDYVDVVLDLNSYMVDDAPSTFMVRANGDSMTGAHIFNNDVLVVDKGRSPSSGDIVVASVEGEFTVKRLQMDRGRPVLRAENPAYPDIVPTYDQEMVIWGVVTGSLRKF